MAELSNDNTTNHDMLDSAASGHGNYELSGDSCSTLSNGTNNHYEKHDVIHGDNEKLNQFPDDVQRPQLLESAKVPPQHHGPSDSEQEMARQQMLAVDVETKENALKHSDIPESEEVLEDWQILKRTTIEGQRCKLVPYTADHVPTYNKWLNDPYIQQMTQTEPYSLMQEYEYQKEWYDDRNKYIFIILDRSLEDAMAGDINLFIQNEEEQDLQIGELNIMIAEDKSRRKGIATETLQLILEFARKHFELRQFIAKIQHDNESSIKLFKKVGFVETDYVETFKEYTFSLILEDEEDLKSGGNAHRQGQALGMGKHPHSEHDLLQHHDCEDCSSFHTDRVCAKCAEANSPKNGTVGYPQSGGHAAE